MFAFSVRRPMASAVRATIASCVACAGALSAGGCASTNASYSSETAYVAQGPSPQLESDGLPVQAAPSAQIRQLPDDPTQPFSPNYGGTNPAGSMPSQPTVRASNDVPAKSAVPADLPPVFRGQLVTAINAAG